MQIVLHIVDMKRLYILVLMISLCAIRLLAQEDYKLYLDNAYTAIQDGRIEDAQRAYNVYKKMTNKKNKELESLLLNNIEHEYVDLGLSVDWATCNIGALKPEESGDYFAWGETKTKSEFSFSTYKFSIDSVRDKYSKYNNTDYKTMLDPEDDVAHVLWGEPWRMPSKDEFDELVNNCVWVWTKLNGISGYTIKSKVKGFTNNSIFLPAPSVVLNSNNESFYYGQYWSRTTDYDQGFKVPMAFCKDIDSKNYDVQSWAERLFGFNVRPVRIKNDNSGINNLNLFSINADNNNSVEKNESNIANDFVDMGLSVKWATCNVGATKPEELGSYYAWGEITPKPDEYYHADFIYYRWCKGTQYTLTKYCTKMKYGRRWFKDNKTTLEPSDDIATVKLGREYRMPTVSEIRELLYNCTWTDTIKNGVKGFWVTSNKSGYEDQSIFFPYAYYWTSSLDSDDPRDAYSIDIKYNNEIIVSYLNENPRWVAYNIIKSKWRYYRNQIRPVKP